MFKNLYFPQSTKKRLAMFKHLKLRVHAVKNQISFINVTSEKKKTAKTEVTCDTVFKNAWLVRDEEGLNPCRKNRRST